jgi:hypothetical protein
MPKEDLQMKVKRPDCLSRSLKKSSAVSQFVFKEKEGDIPLSVIKKGSRKDYSD